MRHLVVIQKIGASFLGFGAYQARGLLAGPPQDSCAVRRHGWGPWPAPASALLSCWAREQEMEGPGILT